jgi:outer membrane protein OmpA-like peptidoglycan-associated protein
MKRSVAIGVLLLASVALLAKASDHRKIKMVPITGRVINDETRSPVATKLKILVGDFSVLEIDTNEQGEFFATIPESAECTIVIRANGFEDQNDVVTFAPNASHFVEIRLFPLVKLIMDGEVISGKDKHFLNAELKVFRNSDFAEAREMTISDGKYSETFNSLGFYIVDFSAKGFVDVLDTVWILNSNRKTLHKNITLSQIEEGLTIQLKNVFFNFGKTSVAPESFAELDHLVDLFSHNPSLRAEIAGHTDADGPDDYNLVLSQARAQEVVNYLKSKGVSESRLIPKGYGETKPIDSNGTLAGKANNRRVEMTVLKD